VTISLHRGVQSDTAEFLRYYDEIGGRSLGDAFFEDLMARLTLIGDQPRRFPRWRGEIRRANLTRFPCHLLFRIVGEQVRVLVVRHHRRHPEFGLSRR
jgi:plasmid stabilization system protein ParE